MPKGRLYMPSREREGIWFRHLGPKHLLAESEESRDCCSPSVGSRKKDKTTTGKMLADPFDSASSYYPPLPPPKYYCMDMTANEFSKHDNRHAFQGHGIYFGNGRDTRFLGKKLGKTFEERPQFTEPDFLLHYGRIVTECDYNTIYSDNYHGCPLSATDARSFHRRFPKAFPTPNLHRSVFNDQGVSRETSAPCRTPLETLTKSQQPYLKDTGRWKYSYNGLPRVYPRL